MLVHLYLQYCPENILSFWVWLHSKMQLIADCSVDSQACIWLIDLKTATPC